MSVVSPTTTKELLDSPVLKSAISKASFRLMPMLVILYVVAFLDRTNVGFAEAALGVDKGITAGAYALGPASSSLATPFSRSHPTCC